MIFLLRLFFCFIFLLAANYSFASPDEDLKLLESKEKNSIKLGGGFFFKPNYLGASSTRVVWFPTVNYSYKDRSKKYFNEFQLYGPIADLTIFDSNKVQVSFLTKYDFGRQSGDDNSLTTLKDIDSGFEIGSSIAYEFIDNLSAEIEIETGLTDIGDERKITIGIVHKKSVWVDFMRPLINRAAITTTYANSEWMNTWFSTPSNSKYSLYNADSGFYNYKLSNMTIIPAGETISYFMSIDYERLRGEAANSPLVKDQGSKNQYSFMLAIMFELSKF